MDRVMLRTVIYYICLGLFSGKALAACSTGERAVGSDCLVMRNTSSTFQDSQSFCRSSSNRDLATISSSAVQDTARLLLEDFGVQRAWIGLELKVQDPILFSWLEDKINTQSNGVVMSYQGCYEDKQFANSALDQVRRDLAAGSDVYPEEIGSLAPFNCTDKCRSRGTTYAAATKWLDTATFTYIDACLCGNSFGYYTKSLSETDGLCAKACKGDPTEDCGGFVSTQSNVYYNRVFRVNGAWSVWGNNQPNSYGGRQDCVTTDSFKQFKLADESCHKKYRYVCKLPLPWSGCTEYVTGGVAVKTITVNGIDSCLYLSPYTESMRLNWYEARQKCRDLTGDLVTLASDSEHSTMKTWLAERKISEENNGNRWTNELNTGHLWLGAVGNQYRWKLDDQALTYSNFAPGQPNSETDKKCVYMEKQSNGGIMWYSDSCDRQLPAVCLKRIVECASNPCQNGATCRDGSNSYTCDCRPGYSGINCQIDVNECLSNPCANGGTCVNGQNQFTCNCRPGYTGTTCSSDINECASSPCVNGGTCTDQVNRFSCQCPSDYNGDRCQFQNINECASSPCANGGTCIDQVNGYRCQCTPNYSGSNCQFQDVNECLSNPCANGATCVNGNNRWTCNCLPGTTGTNCASDINECSSSPCVNGATCVNGNNQWTCTCPEGYTGTTCSEANGGSQNNSTTAPSSGNGDPDTGASTGDISELWWIAVLVVCIILVLAIIIGIILFCCYKKKEPSAAVVGPENKYYSAQSEHGGKSYLSENGSTSGLIADPGMFSNGVPPHTHKGGPDSSRTHHETILIN